MSQVTCHMSHVTFHLSLTSTATDLPLLTPPLSTVDWFQIQRKPELLMDENFVKIVVTFGRYRQLQLL